MNNTNTHLNSGIAKSLALYPTRESRAQWAEFKKLEMFTLLLQCRFTSTPVLARLWGGMSTQRARANIRTFVDQKLIATHRLPGSGRRVILLTRRGAQAARSLTGLNNLARVDPLAIGQQIAHHTLLMQTAAIKIASSKSKSVGLSGMELLLFDNTVNFGPQRYKPSVDICIAGNIDTDRLPTANESSDGVMAEIELRRKSRSRLDEKISAFAAILDEGRARYGWAIYFAPSGPVRDGLERAIVAYRDDHRNRCRGAADRVFVLSPPWINEPL
jgi:hypothetical protein